MKLIYIGNQFYAESGSMMSSIYTEDGDKSNWGEVQIHLENGGSVNIRQANHIEKKYYNDLLFDKKRKK